MMARGPLEDGVSDAPNAMSPATDAPAHASTPDIVDARWERIQIVVRLRGAAPGPAVRLRQTERKPELDASRGPATTRDAPALPVDAGDPTASMSPTAERDEAGDRVVRFNVMAGPEQMPLRAGRWRLETVDGSVPVCGSQLDAPALDRAFPFSRGELVMTPLVEPATGAFAIDVQLSLEDERAVEARRTSRLWRRRVNRLRRQIFRFVYRVVRPTARRTGRQILFASDSRSELGGNLQVVWERMLERGLDREYSMQTLFKPSITDQRSFRDRFRMPLLLATSDVVLVDDYMPALYRIEDPSVRIVQLWHASGAFKTVGYSRVGKAGAPSPYSRIHKNYSYAIVSSEHDVPFYAEAFGLPESRVVPTGIPRMDRFFDEDARAEGRAAALAAFPAAEGRRTILFAPTFRGGTRTASYDTSLLDYAALHALAVDKDAVVIFKMHPFVREPLRIPTAFADRLIDGTRTPIDVNDLMFLVDLLITDYSSIVFEYSTLGGPMLFFAYDLDAYIAERDFYVPFEQFVPGRIVRTFDELLDAIRHEDFDQDKVAEFASRHFDHLDGTSTDRVIDELVIAR
jgi:CDP-ribitol ribitolphosphotransferase / teichoic acid ribitol-phosphate polymerase